MKRAFLAVVFAAMFGLLLGQPTQANAETNGIYIAPKFLMSFGNAPMGGAIADVLDMNHYSSFTLGGALAVGYDFYPKMNIPLRAEIEYGMRGWGSTSWDKYYYNATVDEYGWEEEEYQNSHARAKFTYSTLMANFYYDFHNSSNFTPYVGAGLGLAFIYGDFSFGSYDDEDVAVSWGKSQTNLAWQIGAGVAYNFTENVAVDVAYRYMNMGYMDCGDYLKNAYGEGYADIDAYLYAHEIMVGLRFTF